MKKEKIFTFKKGLKTWPKEVTNYIGYTPKYFKPVEVDCNCKKSCSTTKMSSLTLERMESKRKETGRSFAVSSWYRCPTHNRLVGGVVEKSGKPGSGSKHLYGKAVDFKVAGMPPSCVQEMMIKEDFKNGGVGRYNTFTHVDTSTKRIWDERSKKTACAEYKQYYLKKDEPVVIPTTEQKRIAELESKVVELSSTLNTRTSELDLCRKELAKQEKLNTDLSGTNTQLKIQVSDLQKDVKDHLSTITKLESDIEKLKKVEPSKDHKEITDTVKENNLILKWIKELLSKIFNHGK